MAVDDHDVRLRLAVPPLLHSRDSLEDAKLLRRPALEHARSAQVRRLGGGGAKYIVCT